MIPVSHLTTRTCRQVCRTSGSALPSGPGIKTGKYICADLDQHDITGAVVESIGVLEVSHDVADANAQRQKASPPQKCTYALTKQSQPTNG